MNEYERGYEQGYADAQSGRFRTCVRCSKRFEGMGVYAFRVRGATRMQAIPEHQAIFCVLCGSNSANVLTDSEAVKVGVA